MKSVMQSIDPVLCAGIERDWYFEAGGNTDVTHFKLDKLLGEGARICGFFRRNMLSLAEAYVRKYKHVYSYHGRRWSFTEAAAFLSPSTSAGLPWLVTKGDALLKNWEVLKHDVDALERCDIAGMKTPLVGKLVDKNEVLETKKKPLYCTCVKTDPLAHECPEELAVPECRCELSEGKTRGVIVAPLVECILFEQEAGDVLIHNNSNFLHHPVKVGSGSADLPLIYAMQSRFTFHTAWDITGMEHHLASEWYDFPAFVRAHQTSKSFEWWRWFYAVSTTHLPVACPCGNVYAKVQGNCSGFGDTIGSNSMITWAYLVMLIRCALEGIAPESDLVFEPADWLGFIETFEIAVVGDDSIQSDDFGPGLANRMAMIQDAYSSLALKLEYQGTKIYGAPFLSHTVYDSVGYAVHLKPTKILASLYHHDHTYENLQSAIVSAALLLYTNDSKLPCGKGYVEFLRAIAQRYTEKHAPLYVWPNQQIERVLEYEKPVPFQGHDAGFKEELPFIERQSSSMLRTKTVRAADGLLTTGPFVRQILDPDTTQVEPVPDGEQPNTLVKVIGVLKTYTGSTRYIFVCRMNSTGPVILACKKVTHPSAGTPAIGVTEEVPVSEALADNYVAARPRAGFFSATGGSVPIGSTALNGTISAAMLRVYCLIAGIDPGSWQSLDDHSIDSIPVAEGVKARRAPIGNDRFFFPAVGGNSPAVASASGEGDFQVTTVFSNGTASGNGTPWPVGSTPSTSGTVFFDTCNTGLAANGVLLADAPCYEIDILFNATLTTPNDLLRMTVVIYYLNDAGAFFPQGSYTTYGGYSSAGGIGILANKITVNPRFPIARIAIQMLTGGGTVALRTADCINRVSINYKQVMQFNPTQFIDVSGVDTAQAVIASGKLYYECQPTISLLKQLSSTLEDVNTMRYTVYKAANEMLLQNVQWALVRGNDDPVVRAIATMKHVDRPAEEVRRVEASWLGDAWDAVKSVASPVVSGIADVGLGVLKEAGKTALRGVLSASKTPPGRFSVRAAGLVSGKIRASSPVENADDYLKKNRTVRAATRKRQEPEVISIHSEHEFSQTRHEEKNEQPRDFDRVSLVRAEFVGPWMWIGCTAAEIAAVLDAKPTCFDSWYQMQRVVCGLADTLDWVQATYPTAEIIPFPTGRTRGGSRSVRAAWKPNNMASVETDKKAKINPFFAGSRGHTRCVVFRDDGDPALAHVVLTDEPLENLNYAEASEPDRPLRCAQFVDGEVLKPCLKSSLERLAAAAIVYPSPNAKPMYLFIGFFSEGKFEALEVTQLSFTFALRVACMGVVGGPVCVGGVQGQDETLMPVDLMQEKYDYVVQLVSSQPREWTNCVNFLAQAAEHVPGDDEKARKECEEILRTTKSFKGLRGHFVVVDTLKKVRETFNLLGPIPEFKPATAQSAAPQVLPPEAFVQYDRAHGTDSVGDKKKYVKRVRAWWASAGRGSQPQKNLQLQLNPKMVEAMLQRALMKILQGGLQEKLPKTLSRKQRAEAKRAAKAAQPKVSFSPGAVTANWQDAPGKVGRKPVWSEQREFRG